MQINLLWTSQNLSTTSYQYEHVPKDFEATSQVDESGLVVDCFVHTNSGLEDRLSLIWYCQKP